MQEKKESRLEQDLQLGWPTSWNLKAKRNDGVFTLPAARGTEAHTGSCVVSSWNEWRKILIGAIELKCYISLMGS